MALIKCEECGKNISDKATTCPSCGHPTNKAEKPLVQIDSAPRKRKKYRIGLLIFTPIFLVGIILSMIWWASTITGGEGEQLGFWLFVTFVGLVGMIISKIGSWLSKP